MTGVNPPPLEVRDLAKAYRRRPVLRGIDLTVAPGDALAVVGPNGAGKSTFLGCITGDRRPDAGEVRLCGADPFSDLRGAAKCMGYVPEQPFLYPELTVGEVLSFAARARELPAEAGRAEADRLLQLLGIAATETILCRELSQGMGRKVAITLALLHRPRLIILDEALNGLDQPSTRALVAELDERRARGDAVVLSSHDLDFLAAWADRGLLLAPEATAVELSGRDWERWRNTRSLEV